MSFRNLSQSELAALTDIPQPTISGIENGRTNRFGIPDMSLSPDISKKVCKKKINEVTIRKSLNINNFNLEESGNYQNAGQQIMTHYWFLKPKGIILTTKEISCHGCPKIDISLSNNL